MLVHSAGGMHMASAGVSGCCAVTSFRFSLVVRVIPCSWNAPYIVSSSDYCGGLGVGLRVALVKKGEVGTPSDNMCAPHAAVTVR